MSILPIVKLCRHTDTLRLFTRVWKGQHSIVFRLKGPTSTRRKSRRWCVIGWTSTWTNLTKTSKRVNNKNSSTAHTTGSSTIPFSATGDWHRACNGRLFGNCGRFRYEHTVSRGPSHNGHYYRFLTLCVFINFLHEYGT